MTIKTPPAWINDPVLTFGDIIADLGVSRATFTAQCAIAFR